MNYFRSFYCLAIITLLCLNMSCGEDSSKKSGSRTIDPGAVASVTDTTETGVTIPTENEVQTPPDNSGTPNDNGNQGSDDNTSTTTTTTTTNGSPSPITVCENDSVDPYTHDGLVVRFGTVPVTANIVAGTTSVRIGCLIIEGSHTEDVGITSLTLNLENATLDNADLPNFQLTKVTDDVQVSSTKQLSFQNEAFFTFTSNELIIAKDGATSLWVLNDVASTAVTQETFSVSVKNISATGKPSSNAITVTDSTPSDPNTISASSATMTIVDHGSLSVSHETSVTSITLLANTSVTAASYSLKATDEDTVITKLYIVAVDPSNTANVAPLFTQNIASVELFGNGVKIGQTLLTTGLGVSTFTFAYGDFMVEVSTPVQLDVIITSTGAPSIGGTLRIGIASDSQVNGAGYGDTWGTSDGYLIEAFGDTSGIQLPTNAINHNNVIYGGPTITMGN